MYTFRRMLKASTLAAFSAAVLVSTAQEQVKLGQAIDEDPELAQKLDGWCEDSAKYIISNYGHEFSSLIESTIKNWDTEATSRRIELQIGRDLQFIRINGTVVGGLFGLVIHGILHAIELAA